MSSKVEYFPNPRQQELVVLADGPWSACWYWLDDLQRLIEHGGEFARYRPTEKFRKNPEKPAEQGREWRYEEAS